MCCVIQLYYNLHVQNMILFSTMHNRTWNCFNPTVSSLCLRNNQLSFWLYIFIYILLYFIIYDICTMNFITFL